MKPEREVEIKRTVYSGLSLGPGEGADLLAEIDALRARAEKAEQVALDVAEDLRRVESARDDAVHEANRRDEKWMDGIRSICRAKISFDGLTDDFPHYALTLDRFIRGLESERDTALAREKNVTQSWKDAEAAVVERTRLIEDSRRREQAALADAAALRAACVVDVPGQTPHDLRRRCLLCGASWPAMKRDEYGHADICPVPKVRAIIGARSALKGGE